MLAIGVVRQAYEVASQVFGPTQQHAGVIIAVGAAGAVRRLFVHRNAAQEYRLAVEQDVEPAHFNAAEANLIADVVGFGGDLNAVELGVFRRPQL